MAHWVGLAGEALNFCGAVVLALDLIFRRHEFNKLKELKALQDLVEKHNIKDAVYRKTPVDPDFSSSLLARRANRLGLAGTVLLCLGFSLLATYHFIQILHPS